MCVCTMDEHEHGVCVEKYCQVEYSSWIFVNGQHTEFVATVMM